MKRRNHIQFLIVSIWILSSSFTAVDKDWVNNNPNLFKIGRSRDANEIWYTLNLDKDGVPHSKNPIKVYWVKKTDNNRIEPLSWIQKKYAYGIKILESDNPKPNEWRFQFVSYEKRTFILRKGIGNSFKVYTKSNNKEIEVTRIFVQIDGGSFLVPSISFVKLEGFEAGSRKIIAEKIIP